MRSILEYQLSARESADGPAADGPPRASPGARADYRRSEALHRYFELPETPRGEKAARMLLPYLIAQQRHDEADEWAHSIKAAAPQNRFRLAEIQDELEAESVDRARRREIECEIAQKLDDVRAAVDPHNCYRLRELAEEMRCCRHKGTVGLRPGGGYVVAWDHKCGDVHLCPDEAREETQRLATRYVPAIIEWARAKPTRRVFYAVFTFGNFEPDRLQHGKQFMFERFRKWMDAKRRCTDDDRERFGYGPRKQKVRRWRPGPDPEKGAAYEGPGLHGALLVQEDPLSARGDWNVHLNAFLLVEGRFDYDTVRQTWGANVHLREIDPEPRALAAATRELVKYSARHVATKSEAKHAAGETEAPALTDWPPARFIEWYLAQKKCRRTRSYGCMYKVSDPEREALDNVEWVGSIELTSSGSYRVNLIPGDNFSDSGRIGGNS